MSYVTLGLVVGVVKERCVYCAAPTEAVEVRGLKGVRWSQYARCPHVSTVKGPGPTALADLLDSEEVPLGI